MRRWAYAMRFLAGSKDGCLADGPSHVDPKGCKKQIFWRNRRRQSPKLHREIQGDGGRRCDSFYDAPSLGRLNWGVYNLTIGTQSRGVRRNGLGDLSCGHDMSHRMPMKQQVVRDDTTMAAPPNCFGTHHGQNFYAAKIEQFGKSSLKLRTVCVVSIILETADPPIGI